MPPDSPLQACLPAQWISAAGGEGGVVAAANESFRPRPGCPGKRRRRRLGWRFPAPCRRKSPSRLNRFLKVRLSGRGSDRNRGGDQFAGGRSRDFIGESIVRCIARDWWLRSPSWPVIRYASWSNPRVKPARPRYRSSSVKPMTGLPDEEGKAPGHRSEAAVDVNGNCQKRAARRVRRDCVRDDL